MLDHCCILMLHCVYGSFLLWYRCFDMLLFAYCDDVREETLGIAIRDMVNRAACFDYISSQRNTVFLCCVWS